MPELRQNIVTGEWVIVAPGRGGRPGDFSARQPVSDHASPEYVAACPFCPGNEDRTPPEVLRLPPHGPWQVRVVPNKYAALQRHGLDRVRADGPFRARDAAGWHEVVIASRRHNAPPTGRAQEVALTLMALQRRGVEMARDPRVAHIVCLKNHGPKAGTSQAHPHWQIVALPLVPLRVQRRVAVARQHWAKTGACPLCQMWQAEAASGARVVAESERFLAFVPYAALVPYHVWIVPKQHGASFRQASAQELTALGVSLCSVLGQVYVGLGNPDFNVVVQSSPVDVSSDDALHWYVTVTPRLIPWGGFELETGLFVNPSSPEENARFLRAVEG